jgi:carbamoyltransferase
MTAILGISAFYHDSAAALVIDGQIVAAAQEERFSRKKHDASFPEQAVRYCLAEAGLNVEELDYVAFYEKPFTKFERILEAFVAQAPVGFASFREAIPVWLKEKLQVRGRMNRVLGGKHRPLIFLDHHESHAASAFFPSPFDEAAILTLDGVGEWSTTTLGVGQGNKIQLMRHLRFPHSLGLLYSAFTAYCGFEVNDGEYKLMGLAPYGQPIYADTIMQQLIDIKPDGSFRLNTDYFTFGYSSRMTNRRFDRLFGGSARQPEAELTQRHADLAASVQVVLTEAILRIAEELHRNTQQPNLVMAGGVALNCVANEQLLRHGPFSNIWIQPAAGDAGGALGAALFVWHQLLDRPRRPEFTDSQHGSFLGPRFSSAEIQLTLKELGASYQRIADPAQLNVEVARRLAAGQIVGWFRGRMEFGPRALGSRSILADPRRADMQAVLNRKTKLREGFRPFAPAVLAEHVAEWFDLPADHMSPYMLLTGPVDESRRTSTASAATEALPSSADFSRRATEVRSTIPAVTHVDHSARVQTVDAERNPAFHALLTEFQRLTGCPVLVNTSFNVRGEPMVCTPEDAFHCFATTGIDVLVLEDCIVEKGNTPLDGGGSRSNPRLMGLSIPPPTTRQLCEFAAIGTIIFVGLALGRVIKMHTMPLTAIYAAAALLLGLIGFVRPRLLAPIFSTWLFLTAPVAWVVSAVLLAVVYYGVVTPLGLLFRLIGRDELDRRFRSGQDTYWREKPAATDTSRYLQQF